MKAIFCLDLITKVFLFLFNNHIIVGTDIEQLFLSFDCSLSQHCDPDEPAPTIGLWGNLGKGEVLGGEFIFSRRNLVIPMNPKGTMVIWYGQREEHGTAMLECTEEAVRCVGVIGRKGKFKKIREENRFKMYEEKENSE